MHKNPLSTNTRQLMRKQSGPNKMGISQKNDIYPKQRDLDSSHFTSQSSVPYVTNLSSATPDHAKKINSSGYVTNFSKQNNMARSQIWQRQNQALSAEDEIQVNMQQMLAESGLQIHPKQSQKLMGNAKLQKMLKSSQTSHDKIAKILKKASNVQHGINEAISQFGAPQNRKMTEKELDGQLRSKIESIFSGSAEVEIPSVSMSQSPTQKKLENEFQQILKANLEEQIAAKIAEEITKKITFTYDEQQMQDGTLLSPKNRITTKRHQQTYLKKPTFSSQMKMGSPKRKYLKKKDGRTDSLNVSAYDNHDNSNSVEITQRNESISTDPFNLNKSFSHKVGQQNRFSQKKRTSVLTGSRSMKKMPTVNQRDVLQQQIEEQTQELTERMKQMSVYDFYQMQNANPSGSEGRDLIDAFIKKQLLESNLQNQQQPTPGVAPQVNKSFQHISNNDLISRNNQSSQSLKNLSISVDQGVPSQVKHQKNNASIIIETNDEHFQSQSINGSPQFGPSKPSMGRNQAQRELANLQSFSKDTVEQIEKSNDDLNVILSPKAEEGHAMATNPTNMFKAYSSVEKNMPNDQKVQDSSSRFRNTQRDSFRSQGSIINQLSGRPQHQKIVNVPQQQKYYKDVQKRYNNSGSRNSLGLHQQSSPPKMLHERIGSAFAQKKHSTPVVAKGISIRMTTEEKKPAHQKSYLIGEENERLTLKRSFHQKSVPSLPQKIESQNWKKYEYQKNEYTNPFKNMFFNKSIDQSNTKSKDRITQLQEKYKKNLLGSEQQSKENVYSNHNENTDEVQKTQKTSTQIMQNMRRDRQTRSMDSQKSSHQAETKSVDRTGRMSQDVNNKSSTGNLFDTMINKRLNPASETLLDEIQEIKIKNRLKSKSPACYNGAKQNDLNTSSVYQDLRVKQKQNSKSTRPKSGGSKNKAQSKQLQRVKYKANETEPLNEYGNPNENTSQNLPNESIKSSGQKSRTFGQNNSQINEILRQPVLISKDRRTYQPPAKGLSKSYTQKSRKMNQYAGISKQVAQKDMVSTPSASQRDSVKIPGGHKKVSDLEIKQLRIKAQNAAQQVNIVALREIDQIRKPQKYMFFMARIYKVYYDLIVNLNNYAILNSKKKKVNRLKQQYGKDFNKDLQDEQISEVSAQDSELDAQIFARISLKFFDAATRELKRLYTQLQDGLKKSEKEMLEKEILQEWTEKLRPFLLQNSSQFQTNTQNLCKYMKKLIENNPGSLNNFQSFAQKVLDLLTLFQNFANMCSKTKNTGGIFSKLHDFVRLCSLYTVKKCDKEILKSQSEPTSAGMFTDDKGSSNFVRNSSTQKEDDVVESEIDTNEDFEREEQKIRDSLLEDNSFMKVEQNATPTPVNENEQELEEQKQESEEEEKIEMIAKDDRPQVDLKIDVRKSSDKMRENDELEARIQAEIDKIAAKRESSNDRFNKSMEYVSPIDAVRNNMNNRRTVFPVQPNSGFAINLVPVDCVSDLSDFEQQNTQGPKSDNRSTKDNKSQKLENEEEKQFTPEDAYSPPEKIKVGSEQSSDRGHELSFEKLPSIFNLQKVQNTQEDENNQVNEYNNNSVLDDKSEQNHGSRVGDSTNLHINLTKSEMSAGSQKFEDEEEDNPPTPQLNSPVPIMNANPIGLVKIETKKDGLDIPQMIDQLDEEMQQIEQDKINKSKVESPEDQNNPYYHMMTKGFVPEYGLYNPEKGITLYEFDNDFYDPDSPDEFRICPGKCPKPAEQSSATKSKSSTKSSPYAQEKSRVIRRQGQGRGRGGRIQQNPSTRTSPGQISRNNRQTVQQEQTDTTIIHSYEDHRINEEYD